MGLLGDGDGNDGGVGCVGNWSCSPVLPDTRGLGLNEGCNVWSLKFCKSGCCFWNGVE